MTAPISERSQASRSSVTILSAVFVGVMGILLSYIAWKFDLNEPPSTSGDEIEYDSLAWELSHGRGFSIDIYDPQFREPYDRAAEVDPQRWQVRGPIQGTVVHRPPLFPALVAGINSFLDRQFWGMRVLNVAAMAGLATLLAGFVVPRWGWRVAAIGLVLLVVVDVRTRLYGRAILTEALSAFFIAGVCVCLIRLRSSQRPRETLYVGVLFGLSILTRTMFIFWTPFLVYLVWRSARSETESATAKTPLLHVLAFLFVSASIVLPWGVRNCRVTGLWLPLGTQGMTELSAGFSDAAWDARGVWVNLASQGFYDSLDLAGLPSIEQQLQMAKYSQTQAVDWIRAHPGKTVVLGFWKIAQELRPRSVTEGILLGLAIVGWFALRGRPERLIFGGVICANLFAIAGTWSVEGRFMVPLMFVQHVLAAAAIACVLQGRSDKNEADRTSNVSRST